MTVEQCRSKVDEECCGRTPDAPRVLRRDESPERSAAVRAGLDEGTAVEEASYCLARVPCEGCDLCRVFCPDLCVTRNAHTGRIEIDYDFCKGCGICAAICPKGAIRMEMEKGSLGSSTPP